jgi:hypothetical protein
MELSLVVKTDMTRKQFVELLALWMEREASNEDAEPYRNAGDRLVDEALSLID